LASSVDVLVFIGWLEETDMVAKRVAQTRFVTCASPEYWRVWGLPRDPDELRGHQCLAFRSPWGVVLDLWKYRRGEEVRSVPLEPRIVGDDRDWTLQAAIHGAGVVRIGDFTARPLLEQGLLEAVLGEWEGLEAPPIHVMYRRSPRPSARVRAFVDFVTDVYTSLEASRPSAGQTTLPPVPMPAWFRSRWVGPLTHRSGPRTGSSRASVRGPRANG
jgi:DNA-binding transcriptional LysR family regulator